MSAVAAVKDRPWLGTGLGSFADVFPAFRSPDAQIRGIFDRAHNTPLEIAVEMGIPFAAVVLVGWALLTLVIMRAALAPASRSLVSVAGAALLFFASLHSLIDYPLQIPGYALFFYLLVGLSCGSALTLLRESTTSAH
jgi:O-antigen ligase